MAKHLPDHHSPLLALGKKVLLWIMLPAALVVSMFYGLGSLEEQKSERQARVTAAIKESFAPILKRNEEAEAKRQALRATPGAITATPAELKAAGLNEAAANALLKRQLADRAANPLHTSTNTTIVTASSGYQAVTPPSADYVLYRKDPTNVKIVGAVPAGTVVKDGNDVVAQCSTTGPCTELKLSKVPDKPGDLDIRDASGKLIGSISVNDKTVGMIMGTIPPPR